MTVQPRSSGTPSGSKVLVTGATSLLGRTVVEQLLERGDLVTCFQRSPSRLETAEVLGDVRDHDAIVAAARHHDAIVHVAAMVGPRLDPTLAYDVNVVGTRNVIDAARESGHLVHISSPSVAFADVAAVGEPALTASYAGRDVYAKTKALAERVVLSDMDLTTVVIRPHLVWGPGDTQLVERIVRRARTGRLLLPDDGRALIDTTYVADAAAAIVAGLDHCVVGDAATGRAWVVTGNDPRPLRELIDGIVLAAGVHRRVGSIPAPVAAFIGAAVDRWGRSGEPPLTYFSARQLSLAHWFDQREVQCVLGWSPRYSVDDGLAELARWYSLTP
jgi:nucleoside-diphosphate-sugar epimerase